MRNIQIILFVILLSLLTACTKNFEVELRESVVNPDPRHPDLPAYSEFGYNNFGAYYDRHAFRSVTRTPLKIVIENGNLYFKFQGSKTDEVDSYYSVLRPEIDLYFIMPNFINSSSRELSLLNDSIIDLKHDSIEVNIFENGIVKTVEVLNGNIHFKKVQELRIDQVFEEMIISGTFQFQAMISGEPSTIDYGRFDMGVGYSTFYMLD